LWYLPLIPGHRIVDAIAKIGEQVKKFHLGEQVAVLWVGHTCNHCRYCLTGKENLCDRAEFTILTTSSNSFSIVDSGARIRLDIKN
jgi:D-arabinose 1-dehydrogenase-like Zn-dependent alcohol dehydrogenase